MANIRNNNFTRFLWVMLSLYFLNISVDVSDTSASVIPENVAFNKQESLIEILIEKICGFEHAIDEADEQDGDQQIPVKKNSFVDHFVIPNSGYVFKDTAFFTVKCSLITPEIQFCPPHFEINSPPPEA